MIPLPFNESLWYFYHSQSWSKICFVPSITWPFKFVRKQKIIPSSFLSLTLNKLLWKHFLVRNQVIDFTSYCKRMSPMDVFKILKLSRSFMSPAQAIFTWKQIEENNNITTNARKSDISTPLTLPSADAKSAVFLRVPSLTKVQVRNFSFLHFPRWSCLIHVEFDMYLRHVKRLVICKC